MPLADRFSPAPREVRIAGAISAVPGLILIVFGLVVLIDSFGGSQLGAGVYAQVGYWLALGAAAVACAGGLFLGKTWARSPAVVIALMTIGIGWYATGPSGQPGFGVPIVLAGVSIIVLLFRRPSRAWALGQREDESEQEASERGGAEGRRRARGE